MIQNNIEFETAVTTLRNQNVPTFRTFESELYTVEEHGYKLSVSKASNMYMTAIVCKVGAEDNEDLGWLRYNHISRFWFTREGVTLDDFFDAFRIISVKIGAPVNTTISIFYKIMNSYLHNISFNYDAVYTKMDFNEERRRIRRRSNRGGQLFPYKSFKGELMKYYLQGMASDMPITKYLAYYHVAEFFFQSIAESEALSEIEQIITRPSFTPHKKDDIRKFYEKIKKIMRNQREDGLWDEKNGLLICLKKYIPDLNDLKDTIKALDTNALEYYKNNEIDFASTGANKQQGENVKINFDEGIEKVYKSIRNRVYLVRNAIVHGKEGERLRYEPFRHDKELQKEIPLIRAVAEEIIINSAKPLEIEYQ